LIVLEKDFLRGSQLCHRDRTAWSHSGKKVWGDETWLPFHPASHSEKKNGVRISTTNLDHAAPPIMKLFDDAMYPTVYDAGIDTSQ
jgi:hypothetical protein